MQGIRNQEDDSMSLNQNTLIEVYNRLDSSDDIDEDSSSNEQPLSQSRLMQMQYMRDIEEVRNQHAHQNTHHQKKKRQRGIRPSVRQIRDIESKYDFDVSGETKEDSGLNRLSHQNNRKSYQMNLYTGSHLPDIESDSHQENEFSEEDQFIYEQQISQSSQESGRKAKLGNLSKKRDIKIADFLNVDPVYPEGKGLKRDSNFSKFKAQDLKPKNNIYKCNSSRCIQEDDTIQLITLPIIQNEKEKKIARMVDKSEKELNFMKNNMQQRLNSARLTFYDNFLPEPMKIKSNPYNLLKYMNNRIRI